MMLYLLKRFFLYLACWLLLLAAAFFFVQPAHDDYGHGHDDVVRMP